MMAQRYQPQRSPQLSDHWLGGQEGGGHFSKYSGPKSDLDSRYIVKLLPAETSDNRMNGSSRIHDNRRLTDSKLSNETGSVIYGPVASGTLPRRPDSRASNARNQAGQVHSSQSTIPRFGGRSVIVTTRGPLDSSTLPRTSKQSSRPSAEYINFGQLTTPARLLSRYSRDSSDTDGGTSSDCSYSPKILLHSGPTASGTVGQYGQTPAQSSRSISSTMIQGHGVEYHPKTRVSEKRDKKSAGEASDAIHAVKPRRGDAMSSVYVNGNGSFADLYFNEDTGGENNGYLQNGNSQSFDTRNLNAWSQLNNIRRLNSAEDLSDNSSSSRTLVPKGWTGSADDLLDMGRNGIVPQPSIIISSPRSVNDTPTWSDRAGDLSLSPATSLSSNSNQLSHYRSLPDCRIPTSGSILKKPKHHVTRVNSRGNTHHGSSDHTDSGGLTVNGRASTGNKSRSSTKSRRVDFQNNVFVYRFDSDGNDSSACSSSECEKLNEEPARDHKRFVARVPNRADTPLPRNRSLLVPKVVRSRSYNDLTAESGGSLRAGVTHRGGIMINGSKIGSASKSPPLQMNASNATKFSPHVNTLERKSSHQNGNNQVENVNTLERKSPHYSGNKQAEKYAPDRTAHGHSPRSENAADISVSSATPTIVHMLANESHLPDIKVSNGGQQSMRTSVSSSAISTDGESRTRYNLISDPSTSSKLLVATVQLSAVDHDGLNPRDLVVQSSKSGRRIIVTTRMIGKSSPSRLNLSLSLPCRVDPYDITAGLDSAKNLVIEATVIE